MGGREAAIAGETSSEVKSPTSSVEGGGVVVIVGGELNALDVVICADSLMWFTAAGIAVGGLEGMPLGSLVIWALSLTWFISSAGLEGVVAGKGIVLLVSLVVRRPATSWRVSDIEMGCKEEDLLNLAFGSCGRVK